MSTKADIGPFPFIPLISLTGFLRRGVASGPVWQIFLSRSLNRSHFAEPVLGLVINLPWPLGTIIRSVRKTRLEGEHLNNDGHGSGSGPADEPFRPDSGLRDGGERKGRGRHPAGDRKTVSGGLKDATERVLSPGGMSLRGRNFWDAEASANPLPHPALHQGFDGRSA